MRKTDTSSPLSEHRAPAIILAVALRRDGSTGSATATTRAGDWTSSKLYSLSEKSRNILKGINNDVRVVVLMTPIDAAVLRDEGAARPLQGGVAARSRSSSSTPSATRCAPRRSRRSSAVSSREHRGVRVRGAQEVRDVGPARRLRLLRHADGPGAQDEGVQGRGAVHLGDPRRRQPEGAEGVLRDRPRRARPRRQRTATATRSSGTRSSATTSRWRRPRCSSGSVPADCDLLVIAGAERPVRRAREGGAQGVPRQGRPRARPARPRAGRPQPAVGSRGVPQGRTGCRSTATSWLIPGSGCRSSICRAVYVDEFRAHPVVERDAGAGGAPAGRALGDDDHGARGAARRSCSRPRTRAGDSATSPLNAAGQLELKKAPGDTPGPAPLGVAAAVGQGQGERLAAGRVRQLGVRRRTSTSRTRATPTSGSTRSTGSPSRSRRSASRRARRSRCSSSCRRRRCGTSC